MQLYDVLDMYKWIMKNEPTEYLGQDDQHTSWLRWPIMNWRMSWSDKVTWQSTSLWQVLPGCRQEYTEIHIQSDHMLLEVFLASDVLFYYKWNRNKHPDHDRYSLVWVGDLAEWHQAHAYRNLLA